MCGRELCIPLAVYINPNRNEKSSVAAICVRLCRWETSTSFTNSDTDGQLDRPGPAMAARLPRRYPRPQA